MRRECFGCSHFKRDLCVLLPSAGLYEVVEVDCCHCFLVHCYHLDVTCYLPFLRRMVYVDVAGFIH